MERTVRELRRARATGRPPRREAPRPAERLRGRAWINGREVGGTDPRYAHLMVSYD